MCTVDMYPRMADMCSLPETCVRMGATAREFVRHNFLLTRHLREYLTLMLALRCGVESHLLAV